MLWWNTHDEEEEDEDEEDEDDELKQLIIKEKLIFPGRVYLLEHGTDEDEELETRQKQSISSWVLGHKSVLSKGPSQETSTPDMRAGERL